MQILQQTYVRRFALFIKVVHDSTHYNSYRWKNILNYEKTENVLTVKHDTREIKSHIYASLS